MAWIILLQFSQHYNARRMQIFLGLLISGVFINYITSVPVDSVNGWENVFSTNAWTPIIPLHHYGNKVYYMGTEFTATWHQASEFCEKIHMTLLTIHSEDENDRISKYIREASKGNQYWTGGSRLIDSNGWLWLSYGKTIEYTNWTPGQPGNINKKCLELWARRNALEWFAVHCDTKLYFICERIQNLSISISL